MAKPFLKWVGGKSQLLPQFKQHLPKKYNEYFEPFFGGGALFFHLEPKRATINDLNVHLVQLYKQVRDNTEELLEQLRIIQSEYLKLDHDDRKSYYYQARDEYNTEPSGTIRNSALLVFLNKTGFNGMYRENPSGKFNIPFGRNSIAAIYDPEVIANAASLLKKTTILNGSYEQALEQAKKGDFIYLDPPYIPLTKTSNFTQYTKDGFGSLDHQNLKSIVDDLANRGCFVMLSNSNLPLVKELYMEYNVVDVSANRFINCKPSGRGKISELLITTY